ncbi:MAG: hypothetical protein JO202_05415 [Ktedonobacteraceae bacterium]|nr:hypothetical protein [Ktedonobacteraceae bacterium]
MQENTSEVARVLQQIEAEYQAAQRVFHDPGFSAAHAFITARQERIAEYVGTLREQVGDHEAFSLLTTFTLKDQEKHP